MTRKYTVKEIEDLRSAVEANYLYGSYKGPQESFAMSRCFKETEKAAVVEQEVRTFMQAGLTAKDLLGS